MSFFPIAVQVVFAILFEVSNLYSLIFSIVSEVESYSNQYIVNSNTAEILRDYLLFTKVGKYVLCAAVFIRDVLMNYTLGMTSLSTALERYIAVVHPFEYKKYVKDSWAKKQCILLTILIVSPLLITIAVKLYKVFDSSFWQHTFDCVMHMDDESITENWVRVTLYFLLPLLACGFMHYQTVKGLNDLQHNLEQNRSLVKAIIATWVAWLVLRTPAIVASSLKATISHWGPTMFFFQLVCLSAKSLYVQLNTLLILAVYKPLRDRFIDYLKSLANCFFKTGYGFKIQESSARPGASPQSNQIVQPVIREKSHKIPVLVLGFLCISIAVQYFSVNNASVVSDMNPQLSEVAKLKLWQSGKLIKMRQRMLNAATKDPRINCSDERGIFTWQFNRCYVFSDGHIPRNYSEQKSDCEYQGMTLAYPRTMDESDFIRDYYKHKLHEHHHCSSLDKPLPIGFEALYIGSQLFSSDGKFEAAQFLRSEKPTQLAYIDIPTEPVRFAFHQVKGFNLLCYRGAVRNFDFCGPEAQRYCHVCFRDV